ncbi:aminoacyl-tRNA hydrolase [Brevifollis gellanilyticus]|uniref:Peptidyl-tRNA hydrolase n=1 Tax=Brevifollis gellanilyticus TaxID=748831 RepID=A0A512MAX1_9BACT|nr:aminoacyl-tRNA hydrolase [Brevifollis gellanilyticus]GEP43868.1 peptidyl-tRNA hydrolase [Brevifollis gellanilyticus]
MSDAGGVIPKLIVGLGNPGLEYRDTRHNIGFMVVDELARRFGVSFTEEKRWHGLVAKIAGAWLLKPQTYMNDSGRSARAVGQFYKVTPAETLAVYDDVDLPLGRVRMRLAGSAGGHNGIKSMIASLGTDAFPRLKLGIAAESGRPAGDRLVGHVLGKFREEELPTLNLIVQTAADALINALQTGLDAAMNRFNRTLSL